MGDGGETVLVVQVVRRAHGDHVHVVAAHGFLYITGRGNAVELLPRLRQAFLIGIAKNDKPHTGYLPIRAQVAAPHAETNDCYAKFIHRYTLSRNLLQMRKESLHDAGVNTRTTLYFSL